MEDGNQTANFVYNNSVPVVIDFPSRRIPRIFYIGKTNYTLVLALNKTATQGFDEIAENYRLAAEHFRGKVRFIVIDTTEELSHDYRGTYRIPKSDVPQMRLLSYASNHGRFKPENESDFRLEVLTAFVQDVIDAKVERYVASQELPEDWNKHLVKTLVSSNFKEIAYDKSKTVLVLFFSDGIGDSDEVLATFNRLAQHYEDNKDMVFAKLDVTLNDIEEVRASSGNLKLYRKGSNEVVGFSGTKTLENMKIFVDSDGHNHEFFQYS